MTELTPESKPTDASAAAAKPRYTVMDSHSTYGFYANGICCFGIAKYRITGEQAERICEILNEGL